MPASNRYQRNVGYSSSTQLDHPLELVTARRHAEAGPDALAGGERPQRLHRRTALHLRVRDCAPTPAARRSSRSSARHPGPTEPGTLVADDGVRLEQVGQRRRDVADLVVGSVAQPAEQPLVGGRRSRRLERRVLDDLRLERPDVGEADEPVDRQVVLGGERQHGVEARQPTVSPGESSCDSVVRSTPARSANSPLLSRRGGSTSPRRSAKTSPRVVRSGITRSVDASDVRGYIERGRRDGVQPDHEGACGGVADCRRRGGNRRGAGAPRSPSTSSCRPSSRSSSSACSAAWYNSLQHEVIHGHPTPWHGVNTAIAIVPARPRRAVPPLPRRSTWPTTGRPTSPIPTTDPESFYVTAADVGVSRPGPPLVPQRDPHAARRMVLGPPVIAARWMAAGVRNAADTSRPPCALPVTSPPSPPCSPSCGRLGLSCVDLRHRRRLGGRCAVAAAIVRRAPHDRRRTTLGDRAQRALLLAAVPQQQPPPHPPRATRACRGSSSPPPTPSWPPTRWSPPAPASTPATARSPAATCCDRSTPVRASATMAVWTSSTTPAPTATA